MFKNNQKSSYIENVFVDKYSCKSYTLIKRIKQRGETCIKQYYHYCCLHLFLSLVPQFKNIYDLPISLPLLPIMPQTNTTISALSTMTFKKTSKIHQQHLTIVFVTNIFLTLHKIFRQIMMEHEDIPLYLCRFSIMIRFGMTQ